MGRREGGGKGAADHGLGPLVLDTLSSFSDERLWTVRRAVFAENEVGMWVVPASLRILALKGDRLAVVARDSLDVETLLMLGVREGRAPL